MKFTDISQPWSNQKHQQTRLPIRANAKYFFAHNPENWELRVFERYNTDEGKRKKQTICLLLPVLSTIREVAGVNGTKAIGNSIDSGVMRTKLRDNGWTILDASKHNYMTVYPAIKGTYYGSRWTTLEKVGTRMIEHFDTEGFDQWRLELMQDGHISTPHPQIASLRLLSMSRAMSRLERDQHIPEVATRLKAKQLVYKQTKAAIKRIEDMGAAAYAI